MPITFYTDTHIAKAIATQLRIKGVAVVRCEEVNMATASDEQHLIYTTKENYVLVSQDDDFANLHWQWQQDDKNHSGIMLVPKYLQSQSQISFVINTLLEYHQLIEAGAGSVENDIVNQLIYL